MWALVRARNGEEAQARLAAALAPRLPDQSAWEDRIVAVPGDLTQPGLGLDARMRDELAERVDWVIHGAASVSFTLPLEQARAINVSGTQRVLDFAEDCAARGGLRRLSHVSTAYVAGTHRGRFGEDDLDVGQTFNNSYEQSKWEAERRVRAHASHLPIQVLRPSIVVGETDSGWTSSFNVIYTPLRAFARGVLPAIPARRSAPVDVVSVSYVADAILALGDGTHPCRTYHLTAGRAGSDGRRADPPERGHARAPGAGDPAATAVPARAAPAAAATQHGSAPALAGAQRRVLPVLRPRGALRHRAGAGGARSRGHPSSAVGRLLRPPDRVRRAQRLGAPDVGGAGCRAGCGGSGRIGRDRPPRHRLSSAMTA